MAKSYVPDYEPARQKALELTEGLKTQQEKFDAITKWLNKFITYDYIRATHIKELTGPDVARCYEKREGICMDVSCLAALMFRTVGIRTRIVFGTVQMTDYRGTFAPSWHAWTEVIVDGKKFFYDQVAEHRNRNKVKTRITFTYKVTIYRE